MAISKLDQIAQEQRNILLLNNGFNNLGETNLYTPTHTKALSDEESPIQGKGTGIFLDTTAGGGSLDIHGTASVSGSGRLANVGKNIYNETNQYTAPTT